MVQLLLTVKGVCVPPCERSKVLVAPAGALITRLLIVKVVGNELAVTLSLVTVLEPALVISVRFCPM